MKEETNSFRTAHNASSFGPKNVERERGWGGVGEGGGTGGENIGCFADTREKLK